MSEGTNTVLSHALPSTLISHPCFLCIKVHSYGFQKHQLRRKQIEFCLLLYKPCVFLVVVSREFYVKKFINILE